MAHVWKEGDEGWYFRPDHVVGTPPPRPFRVHIRDSVQYGDADDPVTLFGYSPYPHPRLEEIRTVELGDRKLLLGSALYGTQEAAYAAYRDYLKAVVAECDARIALAADMIDRLEVEYVRHDAVRTEYQNVYRAAQHDGLIVASGPEAAQGEPAEEGRTPDQLA